MTPLVDLVQRQRLLVCVGSGGVGKTTSAAAIALRAALSGRRVLVLTIDPARRLANSLGLSEFGNTEVRIDLGDRTSTGELWAMMLDAPSTLDDVISRVAKDTATRDAIFANKIYRHMAGSFSGRPGASSNSCSCWVLIPRVPGGPDRRTAGLRRSTP